MAFMEKRQGGWVACGCRACAGIGSATAIYTVADAVMLKSLPYRDGDRFMVLFGGALMGDS